MNPQSKADINQLLAAMWAAANELSDIIEQDTSVGHYDVDTRYRDFVCQTLERALDKFPPPPPLNYEDESVQVDEHGQFLCLCGNSPGRYGFFPCGPDGTSSDEAQEPGSDRPPLWRCDKCRRIFHEDTGTVLAELPAEK